MVQEKLSLVRIFLSCRVKPNHSNRRKKGTNFSLILEIHLTCKFIILDIKRKQNDFFGIFKILAYFSQL